MPKLVFLTKEFYAAYKSCPELEQKESRPYIRIQVSVNGVLWGIPLRSHIRHKNVLWTDKEKGCGLDFSKAVAIIDPVRYISPIQPHIREEEFKVLKQVNEHFIAQKMYQYIKDYKKAKEHPEIKRNKDLISFSTLQYFEDYL